MKIRLQAYQKHIDFHILKHIFIHDTSEILFFFSICEYVIQPNTKTSDMWHVTCDTWYVTCDIWQKNMLHTTYDRWGEINLLSKFQLTRSPAYRRHWISWLMQIVAPIGGIFGEIKSFVKPERRLNLSPVNTFFFWIPD